MTADSASTATKPLGFDLNFKLSTMMFLQYAIWGAWLPLLWPFLFGYRGFDSGQISHMFMVGAVGAIVAPFIAGQIADRYFRTEIFLAISHLIGAVLIWQLASLETYGSFLLFSLVYSLVYSPTLSLTNSLSFHHLPDRDRDFGKVRVWGTIGWIVVGIGIGQWLLAEYTLEPNEATQRIVSERILDAEERSRLLSQSQVELESGSSTTGRVTSEPGAATVELVVTEGEPPITIAAAEVKAIVPIYARLAAEGKVADVKALLDAVPAGDVSDAQRAELEQRAVEGAVFNDAAIQGAISAEHARGMKDAFKLSAILGLLMGLFCFFLPKTPPAKTVEKNASLRALGEIKKQPLLTLFVLAVPISCIHQFYFV
ncbi:MAG: MFS transporter, partial [Planctomycetota bacterium]